MWPRLACVSETMSRAVSSGAPRGRLAAGFRPRGVSIAPGSPLRIRSREPHWRPSFDAPARLPRPRVGTSRGRRGRARASAGSARSRRARARRGPSGKAKRSCRTARRPKVRPRAENPRAAPRAAARADVPASSVPTRQSPTVISFPRRVGSRRAAAVRLRGHDHFRGTGLPPRRAAWTCSARRWWAPSRWAGRSATCPRPRSPRLMEEPEYL